MVHNKLLRAVQAHLLGFSVGLRYLVVEHKIPFRSRSNGRWRGCSPGASCFLMAGAVCFAGRPPRFGGTQGGGAT